MKSTNLLVSLGENLKIKKTDCALQTSDLSTQRKYSAGVTEAEYRIRMGQKEKKKKRENEQRNI